MKRKQLLLKIGERLTEVRESMKRSRQQMAEYLRIGRSTIYRNEIGASAAELLTCYKIAVEYNVSLDWLICERGEMRYRKPVPVEELAELRRLVREAENREVPIPMDNDVKEMVMHMNSIPLLRFELLAHFHQFKESHKELVQRSMNLPESDAVVSV